VREEDSVLADDERERGQERALRVREPPTRPGDRSLGDVVHVVRLADERRLVVVSLHCERTAIDVAPDEIDHRSGIGAVADEISGEREALRAVRSGVIEAGPNRLEVRVEVCEQRELHDAVPVRLIGPLRAQQVRQYIAGNGPRQYPEERETPNLRSPRTPCAHLFPRVIFSAAKGQYRLMSTIKDAQINALTPWPTRKSICYSRGSPRSST
jgi:hypothetical protein